MEFYPPDTDRFPALAIAYEAGRRGGLAPVVLNAADEVAVEAFLKGQITYLDIPRVLEAALEGVPEGALSWESIELADREARIRSKELLKVKV
ncbi:1-deoxy-D-xylulose 5-phosphate reductoisomerase [Calidithermus roseus]|uniref:1-deoxy-D-xylulose 5-phosphate reductoisomerase n=1 Tax=Calidithermus roseus TaxID=1644118 RepID=A0A399EWN6_9DEIN|nr:1-deoxy-D-xylulose 5-phosphate reductoisomerase [Calidithermus roseus]